MPQRKIPAPGFQLVIVMVELDGSIVRRHASTNKSSDEKPVNDTEAQDSVKPSADLAKDAANHNKDDVFSDSESEGTESSRSRHADMASSAKRLGSTERSESQASEAERTIIGHGVEQASSRSKGVVMDANAADVKYEDNLKTTSMLETPNLGSSGVSDFKPVAADASVFSFGDEDEYESD